MIAVDHGGQRRHSLEERLLLGVITYNLGNLLRWLVLRLTIQSWWLTSLQQRLFKTGGRLIRHARYFILQLRPSGTKVQYRPTAIRTKMTESGTCRRRSTL